MTKSMKAAINWKENMYFVCDNNGHEVHIDASREHGGSNKGTSPKMLLLNAMMSCTAIDTLSILNKMRQKVTGLQVEIEGFNNDTYPIHFNKAMIHFIFEGEIHAEKLIKAASKSLSQYCGINYMVSKVCEISFKITLNGTHIHSALAQFNHTI